LAARCYLGPFGREETTQFVRAQVAASSGAPDELFSMDVWDAIFEATDGVPRLVNQVCDRALMDAAEAKRVRIDRSIIQAAWADIQQLPAPWDTPAPTTAPPAPLQVVEFGQLGESAKSESIPVPQIEIEDEYELADIESTELDQADDDVVMTAKATPSAANKSADERFCVGVMQNPFAEEFDEEEVVIDSFASWDDMFHRDVPRVQNRRDPEFSSMLQSAIVPPATNEPVVTPKPSAALRMLGAEFDDFEVDAAKKPVVETSKSSNDAVDWPPLRIAIMPESTGLGDLGVTPPANEFHASDWNVPQSQGDGPSWLRRDTVPQAELPSVHSSVDEGEPVLIVVDDNPGRKAPVRREEYRNLFSRLRSG
jgi:hypothetical protein